MAIERERKWVVKDIETLISFLDEHTKNVVLSGNRSQTYLLRLNSLEARIERVSFSIDEKYVFTIKKGENPKKRLEYSFNIPRFLYYLLKVLFKKTIRKNHVSYRLNTGELLEVDETSNLIMLEIEFETEEEEVYFNLMDRMKNIVEVTNDPQFMMKNYVALSNSERKNILKNIFGK